MAGEITISLTALQSAIKTATNLAGGDLEAATPPQLAPVKVALNTAIAAIIARLTVIEALIDETTVGGLTAGVPATTQITTLIQQVGYIREADALHNSYAYLTRIGANILAVAG